MYPTSVSAYDLPTFFGVLEELFHIDMDRQTSGFLFGSAATHDWVAGRSDLDLLIFIPEEKLDVLGRKIGEWQTNGRYPILDGYVLYLSRDGLMARRFEEFRSAQQELALKCIPMIDLWNIKNRSKHLFGADLRVGFPEVQLGELQTWARHYIEDYWIPNLRVGVSRLSSVPNCKVPLPQLVWTTSGVARMLMLVEGNLCSSKRDALRWLAKRNSEFEELIGSLIDEYEKSDAEARAFTGKQAFELGRSNLRLLESVRSQ